MKKIFTSLFFLLITLNFVLADSVSKSEAQKIAENFYSAQLSNKSVAFSVSEVNTFEFEGATTLYIFSFSPNGFVIVSAEDKAYPIIGYSLTNPVGSGINNPSVINRFELYSKQINQTKIQKSQNSEVKQQWLGYKNGNVTSIPSDVAPLLSTTWDQGVPNNPSYNLLCPSYAYTGCVATAMAQIMNYYEWPETGQGWHKYIPSAIPSYGIQYADFASTTYDWANMPDNLSSSSPTAEKNAISTLMYHAGVSVNMSYDASEGSGAFSQDVMFALTSYFKYDPTTINIYNFDANNLADWLTKVKTELDQARPVYYSGGSTNSGGHAWVCDGYDASDNLHINWGWGGSCNGYYIPSAMNPTETDYNFSEYNSIITGIKPGLISQDILWKKQNSSFIAASRGIQNISVVNNKIAWAVAYDGSSANANVKDFTRTTDGGSTWVSGTVDLSSTLNYSAAMISAVSDKKAWVALFGPSGGGKIANTIDGGASWQNQSTATFTAPDGFPNVIHFWDENNGFCMGDPNGGYFEIYTTTNGGTNWNRVVAGNIPEKYSGEYGTVSYYSVYGNTVWFSTNKGRIFKSTDKGYTWVAYQTPITDASFELSFKDESTGIIQRRGSDGTNLSYITTNGGQNWTQLISTGNFYQSSFMFIPGSDLLVSTGSDSQTPKMGVSYSTDNGSTFTDYAEFYKNYQFLALGAASNESIWAGSFNSSQYNGGMWHFGEISISANFSVNKTLANQDDSTVVFLNNSYGSPETWAWDFGEGASPQTITGAGPHTVKYTTLGSKSITLTITKGTDEHIIVKENCLNVTYRVGVDKPEMNNQLTLYPNPATTYIKINGYEKGTVQVFNTTGALVMEVSNLLSNNSLNISNLNTGIYLIKIQTPDGKVITKKLSVSK